MDPATLAGVLQIVVKLISQLQGASSAEQQAYVGRINAALDSLAKVQTPDDHAAAAKAIALAIAGKPPA